MLINQFFFFGLLQACQVVYHKTTKCIHSSLSLAVSFAFSTSNKLRFFFTLSAHCCLGQSLSCFESGRHFSIFPIIQSDLHTSPAQLTLLLFVTLTMLSSPYSSFNSSLIVISNSLLSFFFSPKSSSKSFSQILPASRQILWQLMLHTHTSPLT